MISYHPFYQTLFKKSITDYQLIFKYGFSSNILHRMKHGKAITMKTLDTLCFILDCRVDEVIEHRKE
jgi:DNA-binding Xre family transcriptional regulator